MPWTLALTTMTQPSKTSPPLDDFFSFAVRRTDALDDAADFHAIRFHVTAELSARVFDQFDR